MSIRIGHPVVQSFEINQNDLLGPVTKHLAVPRGGYIDRLVVVVTAAIGTGGTVKLQNSAGQDIPGAVVTLADSAPVGTRYVAVVPKGEAKRAVADDAVLRIVPAAAINGTGAITGFIEYTGG